MQDNDTVIAGMYEIHEQIGSGGGGIVYIGKHIRLDKAVVLKADKRTLETKSDVLRREVDLLKGLSHTYIPQVYDFVQENGVVYTVMDYIDGESLDKVIAKERKIPQPQIIQWACQLLEALSYLHSRYPHGILHADIKPANIMIRENGDVCLIDYNIALALGEDGAVKVGFSRGYASPEHYGADYIRGNQAAAVRWKTTENKPEKNSTADKGDQEEKTIKLDTSVGRGVMLDARSDIYSLGATLYHLLSGKKPAQKAEDVTPLTSEMCSSLIADIIKKSMEPDPEQRYQTAEEMLNAFLNLHGNDTRIKRLKRHEAVTVSILTIMFLGGGVLAFVGLKQIEQRNEALTLAEYSANALAEGDVSEAVRLAMQAIPTEQGIKSVLNAPVTAQAQKALSDALGVYDMSDGFKAVDTLELSGAPFKIALSPDGTRLAVVYAYEMAVYNLDDLSRAAVLSVQESALSDALFVDDTMIVYAGDKGVALYDLDSQEELWMGDMATTLSVSGNKEFVAAVNRDDDFAVVYRISDGEKVYECPFNGKHLSVAANDIFVDPKDNIFELNYDGSLLGVSFSDGGVTLLNLGSPDDSIIIYDESEYMHFEGGFCGETFAFAASGNVDSVFALIDIEKAVYIGGYESDNPIMLKSDMEGVYVANGNVLVKLDLDTQQEMEIAFTDNVNITRFSVSNGYVLAATDDNRFSFYDSSRNLVLSVESSENCEFVSLSEQYAVIGNRNSPQLRIMKKVRYEEAQLLEYDARYSHSEARISTEDGTVMLFSISGFRIYGLDGSMVSQIEMPNAKSIYDQQFIKSADGAYLEVTWYDGVVRRYAAKDGALLSEEKKEAPGKDLYEEFYTEKYRVTSSLHTAPEVYDLESGRLLTTLQTDSYLTYVTELDGYLLTEYFNSEKDRYGLLLDNNFQTVAYLPELCDVSANMLVFDYKSGNLRQCRLYSLQELLGLGEAYLLSE